MRYFWSLRISAGTIFRLGEEKLVKNNQGHQIQSITLCSIAFLEKRYTQCTMGSWGKAPQAGEFSRIFVLKATLPSVRLLLTVSYRKNGTGCTSCSPIILFGEQLLRRLPSTPMSAQLRIIHYPNFVTMATRVVRRSEI